MLRVLLDGGSELSYVRKSVISGLRLPVKGQRELNLFSFGEREHGCRSYDEYELHLSALGSTHSKVKITALAVNELCAPLVNKVSKQDLMKFAHLKNLHLADKFDRPQKTVDVVIGADYMYDVLYNERISAGRGPTAIKSVFGWILHGPMGFERARSGTHATHFCTARNVMDNDALVRSLWDVESIGIIPERELEEGDSEIMDRFSNSLHKQEDGRYAVEWPWVGCDEIEMDSSKDIAEKRLEGLVKRLKKDPKLFEEYDKIIRNYLEQGMAEKVDDQDKLEAKTRYLPHHCVVKPEKETTKVRMVFDAACKDKNGVALNDLMHAGPNLNPELISVLLRFRAKAVCITADIKQAFLQIGLKDADREATRFLWFNDDISYDAPERNEPVSYRMTRVVFGVKASPFLLAATLRHHLNRRSYQDTRFTERLMDNFYVDDLVLSASSIEEAKSLHREASDACAEMCMELRKWRTNDHTLAEDLKLQNESGECSVLGLSWNSVGDRLQCKVNQLKSFSDSWNNPTKREVLRCAAQIFDPLGVLSPYVVIIKCLLQDIWRLKIGWDDELPKECKTVWKRWINEWQVLSNIWFERYLHLDENHTIELHGFADASKTAYAVAVYAKVIDANGDIHVNLVMAKTRIAPMNGETIPRLELLGCLITARLISAIMKYLHLNTEYFCWTDSQVALAWIRSEPSSWKPFVRNRVAEIQSLTESARWRHVKGEVNPADIPSRGMFPTKLKDCKMWWHGPDFLKSESYNEEVIPSQLDPESLEISNREMKKQTSTHHVSAREPVIPGDRFSSLGRLIRVAALVQRFVKNLRTTLSERKIGSLSHEEVQASYDYWIRFAQASSFTDESAKGRLSCVHPILDENGIWRSKGRLERSRLDQSTKNPIILPSDSFFTKLLIKAKHEELMHADLSTVLTSLRSKYWILRARREIKKVLKNCPICRRVKAVPYDEETAPLPIERVETNNFHPFLYVGIDYAGPLFTYLNDQSQSKAYILVITCTRIRAVHLELTHSLTTAEFLEAFDRFVARRGLPAVIFSDNARTFKRAAELLSSSKEVKWKFITERAPWHGGFWERMVRSVKVALRKTLGRNTFDFLQLRTLLCKIEGVINSRPISYIGSEPDVPEPLSPAKFLLGRDTQDNNFFELETLATAPEFGEAYLRQMSTLKGFWERWKCEYLPLLNATHGKLKGSNRIRVGDVVLVHTDDKKKHLWPIGRITALHQSGDGRVRTVSLRCRGAVIRRPIQKLYLLESCVIPIEDQTEVKGKAEPKLKDQARTKEAVCVGTARKSERTIHPPVKYGW